MARSALINAVLLPLSKLYGVATWTRNKMFDWGILRGKEFEVPIIVVGNLAVGGTGKTPHTEYIVRALKDCRKVAVLSRGYKRATKGFINASPQSTPRDIGDEAYQVYNKFGYKVPVAVCEDRVMGIERLKEIFPDLEAIILDDAFQHRYVKPRVSIVLTEFDRPVFEDFMLPYGRLRESVSGLERADIVIVTKCPPGIKPIQFNIFEKDLNLIPAQACFYTRLRYERVRPIFPDKAVSAPRLSQLTERDSILAVCGIANPRPFVKHLKSFAPKVKVNIFPDHHEFTRKDMQLLLSRFNSLNGEQNYIITTEKDAVRLVNNPYFPPELQPYIFYMPVKVEFLERGKSGSFEDTLERMITEKSRIR